MMIACHLETNVMMHATIGGTALVIMGGKFKNGAITSAFVYLYNACQHGGEGCENSIFKSGIESKGGQMNRCNIQLCAPSEPANFNLTVEGYFGPGGGVTIKYDDLSGVLIITGKFGVGLGLNFSVEPFYDPHVELQNVYITRIVFSGGADVGVGPLHGGLSAQLYSANMTSDNSYSPTFNGGFTGVLDTSSSFKPSSYKAGGSIGGSVALELGSATEIK